MPRKTTVVTVSMNYELGPAVKDNIARIKNCIEYAGTQQPDILCLPEDFSTAGITLPLEEKAEPGSK